jgi:hypothetical protein
MGNLTIAAVIISVMFVVSMIVLIYNLYEENLFCVIFAGLCTTMCFIALIFVTDEIDDISSEPTALDVYRGLTELEITSVNGVPQDTVVVFKEIK